MEHFYVNAEIKFEAGHLLLEYLQVIIGLPI